MIAGEKTRELACGKGGLHGADTAAVVIGARRRQARDLAAEAGDKRFVVGDADVGAAALVDVNLGATDVERAQRRRLGAADERRAGDHHVGLFGHIDAVADDRHIAAAGDAVAEDSGELRDAARR